MAFEVTISTMKKAAALKPFLQQDKILSDHPQASILTTILTDSTGTSSAGYPFICEASFHLFINEVPHLYRAGQNVLSWLNRVDHVIADLDDVTSEPIESLARAVRVVRNMVYTAGVTATPDIWLLRQVLSTHRALGLIDKYLADSPVSSIAGLDPHQLEVDCAFLRSRGFLIKTEAGYTASYDPSVRRSLEALTPLDQETAIDVTQQFIDWLNADAPDAWISNFLDLPEPVCTANTWVAQLDELEVGYRLLPLVLAMRAAGKTAELRLERYLSQTTIPTSPELVKLLLGAGMIDDSLCVTELGGRVFQRGPGPFGIIGAYYPYLNCHQDLLRGQAPRAWVNRGANVGASQDANRKTFQMANQALDQFCLDTGFEFDVFIEHAVGRGEATRQRFKSDGDRHRYFGADLEDDAIDRAVEAQQAGDLPAHMSFIRGADIAEPERVVEALANAGLHSEGAIMMVGNGFHEVRDQTNDRMIEVFQGYQQAGVILIFTEESALTDEDLLSTAWNTYHAGFRYVHELSGQGLRPADERPGKSSIYSWRRCAELSGYHCLDSYTRRTRTIYPYPRAKGHNPAISVTHFCVPDNLARRLGVANGNSATVKQS